ncbi:phage portal protein [Lactobacillus gasseri]|uniref:phage portal protein n=1 Tax=Lactobacillus gasseri TaxID=1596 RepID=UPI0021B198C4|nr:phage portal protein [Lactobacillus gasseri]
MIKSLGAITDDPRIAVPAEEYTRIRRAKDYYSDKPVDVKYWVLGNERKRKMNTVNMTQKASKRLASIIFNEQCSIKVNDNDLQKQLDEIFRESRFYTTFETNLQRAIALGSSAIRPYVEDDKIKLNWSDALGVYPLNANTTEVREIALARKIIKTVNDEPHYYTLLEFHQWGNKPADENGHEYTPYTITNELYESTDESETGTQVPLNSIEEYADLPKQATFTHINKPLFAFYRNPGDNNKSFTSPLGLGLCDNCRNILDDINVTQDGFYWDVKTGRRRVIIPQSWVRRQTQINGNPIPENQQMYWDTDDDVFVPVNARMDDSSAFKDLTINIRTDQYQAAMSYFLHEFENEIGLSEGTFTATPTGIQTATGVVSSNSMTYQTRSSYLTQVEDTIDQLVYAIAELLQTPELWSDQQPKWTGDLNSLVITPDFNDGIFIDQDAQFKNDLSALNAGAMPVKEFVKRNYNLSDDEAENWAEQLQKEKATPAPDFEQFNPLAPDTKNKGTDKHGSGTKQDDETGKQDS